MTEKEYLKRLGERISETREQSGLSREALAEGVKLSRIHIYRIEKGENPTSIIILRRISKVLGINLNDLVNI
jgi:transcriptional regulator with XRE-family HTH domain